jgi:hypothetical protein
VTHSARVRRKAGEGVLEDPRTQVQELLEVCIEEDLSDDEIVILARSHKPSNSVWEYGLDRAVQRMLDKMRAQDPSMGSGPAYLDWALADTVPTEPLWCIEGFIERGHGVSISGAAKVGKSLLSLEAAACKASGTGFLGRELEPGVVLYLDYENTPHMVFGRLKAMGFSFADLSNLKYLPFPRWGPLDSVAGSRAVLEQVRDLGAELVFIDTLQRVITGDENSSQSVRDLYRNLIMPLRAEGVATVRLDHLGKNDQGTARGSSAKGDDVDDAWIYGTRKDGLFSLRRTLSRSGAGSSGYLLQRNSRPLQHQVIDGALEADDLDDEESVVDLTVSRLDELQLPNGVGRDNAKKALQQAGYSYSTDPLMKALKIRQART